VSVKIGAVRRLAQAMTTEPARAAARRAGEGAYDKLQEVDQQLMVEISGTAAEIASSTTGEVRFDIGFVEATEQRYSSYTVPLFTYGVALLSVGKKADGSDPPGVPMVVVSLMGWVKRPGPVVVGARIAVTAAFPGLIGEEIDFSGYAHLNFQGFGALESNDTDVDE
jgi:hypothetical protein